MKVKLLLIFSFFIFLCFLIIKLIEQDEKSYLITISKIGCCESPTNNILKSGEKSSFVIKRRVKEFVQSLLVPKKFFIKKPRPEYSFLLSNNDKFIFDSLRLVALNDGLLSDITKRYRDVDMIYEDSLFKVKVKYRGSDPTPLFWNSPSLKIKSKSSVNGIKKFNIISGLEMDYKNIFFNYVGNIFRLYTEGVGEITSVFFNGQIYDGFKYPSFNKEFVLKNYSDTLNNQFKNYKNLRGHSSEFDNLYYNNEKQLNVSKNSLLGIKKYKEFKEKSLILNHEESNYFSKYLALIYLFGNSHQITGDNLTLLDINNNLYPLYRNEGDLNYLNIDKENFDNVIFNYEENAPSYDFFKKLLTKDSFRKKRNLHFKRIIGLKKEIVNSFDSIYDSNRTDHMYFNKRFFRQQLKHKILRNNLISNIKKIESYLEFNKVFFSHEKDTLRISSDSYTKLELIINSNDIYEINQRKFTIGKNKKIESMFKEFKIYYDKKIDSLTIISPFTNKTRVIKNIYNNEIN